MHATPRLNTTVTIVMLLALMLPAWAVANYDIFGSIPGVEGESTDPDHEYWFDVIDFEFDLEVSVDISEGSEDPEVGPVVFRKPVDTASPSLLDRAVADRRINLMWFNLRSPGPVRTVVQSFSFGSVYISNIDWEFSREDNELVEVVTFEFVTFQWAYQRTDADGSPVGERIITGYNQILGSQDPSNLPPLPPELDPLGATMDSLAINGPEGSD